MSWEESGGEALKIFARVNWRGSWKGWVNVGGFVWVGGCGGRVVIVERTASFGEEMS